MVPLTHVVLKETLRLSLTFWCHNDKCFCISEKDVIAWVDKEFPQGLSSMFDKVMHYYYLKRLLVKKSDLVSKKRYSVKKWHSLPAHLRIQISNEYSIFQSMKSSNKLKDPLYENKKRYPNVNDQFSVLNANSKWQECAQKVAWMISQSLLEIDGRMMVLKKHWS